MTTQQIYNTVNRHTYEINQLQSQTDSGVSLTSAGGTETLVNDGTGPTLATKGLSAGTGIILTSDSNSVTINTSGNFVSGPNSSVINTIPVFNSITGKNISNGSATLSLVGGYTYIKPTNSSGLRLESLNTLQSITIDQLQNNIDLYSAGQTTIDSTDGTVFILGAGSSFKIYNLSGSSAVYPNLKRNTLTGDVYYETSSRRYKENITDMSPSEYDKVDLIRPVTYTSNQKSDDPNKVEIGLIAEELYEVFPNLVSLNKDNTPESLSYEKLSILLIGYCKKMKQELINQKQELANQKQEYNNLRSEFETFKNK